MSTCDEVETRKLGVVVVTRTCASAGLSEVFQGLVSGKVIGFRGGPSGLLQEDFVELDKETTIEDIGFGSWTNILDDEFTPTAISLVLQRLRLDGLVLGCGVDELARTAELACAVELSHFSFYIIPYSRNCHITHDVFYPSGSLGFDSAKWALSEYVGNIAVDCLSSKKYWHFVRVGDPILTVHVALCVHVNAVVLQPEVQGAAACGFTHATFRALVESLRNLVVKRAEVFGLRTGVVLISNGAITADFADIKELENVCSSLEVVHRNELSAKKQLANEHIQLLLLLPKDVRVHLLKHGKFVCPSPEAALAHAVRRLVSEHLEGGALLADFRTHYLGHESRSPAASDFDRRLGLKIGAAVAESVNIRNAEQCLVTYALRLGSACVEFLDLKEAAKVKLLERRGYQVNRRLLDELNMNIRKFWAYASLFSSSTPGQASFARRTFPLEASTESLVPRELPLEPWTVRLPLRSALFMSDGERDRLNYVPELYSHLHKLGNLEMVPGVRDWPMNGNFFYSSTSVTTWEGRLCPWTTSSSPPKRRRLSVVFLGSQAPGFHNIVWGIFKAARQHGIPVLGFLGGALGLNEGFTVHITDVLIDAYRNQGGQDMLGHFGGSVIYENAVATVQKLGIDGLVIIGGSKAVRDALELNERLAGRCAVVHVPASFGQDCDAIPAIHSHVGFDTVADVFSVILGNLRRDAISAGRGRRYFVAIPGDESLANAALEKHGLTKPRCRIEDFLIIGSQNLSDLAGVLGQIANSKAPVVLVPESSTPQIEEFSRLLCEVDEVLQRLNCRPDPWLQADLVQAQLSDESAALFKRLSRDTQLTLVLGGTRHPETRELHFRNFPVEKVFKDLNQSSQGNMVLCQSLNYQGRSSLPSDRDCNLGFLLGFAAGVGLLAGATGVSFIEADERALLDSSANVPCVRGVPLLAIFHGEVDLNFKDECKELLQLATQCRRPLEGVIEILESGISLL